MNMMARNRILKKLRSRGGFTLSELLVTMIILLISTSVIVQTLSLAFDQHRRQTLVSEAGILCDTLSLAVQDRLSTEIDITSFEGDAQKFVSLSDAAYGSRGLTAKVSIKGTGEPFEVELTVSDSTGIPLAKNKYTVYPILARADER